MTTNPLKGWGGLLGAAVEPMTKPQSQLLINLMLSDPEELGRKLPALVAEFLPAKIISSRLMVAGLAGKVEAKALFFIAMLCDRPGHAALWAYTVSAILQSDPTKTLTLERFCDFFPKGVPSQAAMKTAWDFQKGTRHGLPKMDNLVDYLNLWPYNEVKPAVAETEEI